MIFANTRPIGAFGYRAGMPTMHTYRWPPRAGFGAVVVYLALLAGSAALIQRYGRSAWSGIAIGSTGRHYCACVSRIFDYLHVLSLGLLFAGAGLAHSASRKKDTNYVNATVPSEPLARCTIASGRVQRAP